MGLVATPQELEGRQRALAAPRFRGGRSLAATYRTDAAAVAAVLPPPLTAPVDPLVHVAVSAFPEATCGPYTGGTVRVAALLDGEPCRYVVAMYMDTDDALLFGRELFGEPKKLAQVSLELDGDRGSAAVHRGGVPLLRLTVALDPDPAPGEAGDSRSEHLDVNLKASLAHDGSGLGADATLVLAHMAAGWRLQRAGEGTVDVASSPHDPLGDLPVREVVSIGVTEGLDIDARLRLHGTVDAATAWPYVAGRLPDWAALAGSS